MRFRLFVELPQYRFRTLLLLDFHFDEAEDWHEVTVYRGQDVIGYMHGYANQGWNPQVNNIWVVEDYRRRGIGSLMMSRVNEYFGEVPMPGTPIADNVAAQQFWETYISGKWRSKPRKEDHAR